MLMLVVSDGGHAAGKHDGAQGDSHGSDHADHDALFPVFVCSYCFSPHAKPIAPHAKPVTPSRFAKTKQYMNTK